MASDDTTLHWLKTVLPDITWQPYRHHTGNEYYIEVTPERWIAAAEALTINGPAVLTAMFANDERSLAGHFAIYAIFSVLGRDLFIGLRLAVSESIAQYPSLTPHIPAAHWYEREIKDMFGLFPVGHPDPRRLVLHHDWPKGLHPMRKSFTAELPVERTPGITPFSQVEGEGVFEVPVGPIHAGITEPGHFRFSVLGENVLHLEAKLFYTHRGIEKMCEDMQAQDVLFVAERICGACSLSHATAYAQAIERIASTSIPQRAKVIRSIALELERLYNHIGDIGNICVGVGFAFGNMQFSQLKEELMEVNERFAGNRFLHGVIALGGVKKDISVSTVADIRSVLSIVEREFSQITELLLDQSEFINRAESTGILANAVARDLGVVGPVARASGIDHDWRRDHAYAAYQELIMSVPLYQCGDVLARLRLRIDETIVSFSLIKQLLELLKPGLLSVEIGSLPAYHFALGYVESPRGADIHWVMTGENNRLYRYMIRSASYPNWASIAFAAPGNIVPDFPLINKSYELCYSCLDR